MDSMITRLLSISIFSLSRYWDLKIYIVESKVGAIMCMVLALLFLGTWPAIMSLLERRGRLPQHTYLDYSITNLLSALLIAFTFGEIGKSTIDNPSFIPQLHQDNWPSVLFAMAGGIVLSIGNLSTQYAWALVGLSVVEVVSSSITVVIGTSLNYLLDDKINRAEILFPGVGCFLIAVVLGSAVHSSNFDDDKAKLNNMSSAYKDGAVYVLFVHNYIEMPYISIFNQNVMLKKCGPVHEASTRWNLERVRWTKLRQVESFRDQLHNSGTKLRATSISSVKEINGVKSKDLESGGGSPYNVKAGTAIFLIELEKKRAIKVFDKSTFIGLAVTLFAGVCFSLFSPAFNLATNDQWHTLKKGVPHLSVYTSFFYFSVSCFVIAIILNITFLYHPILNLPKSSLKAYLVDWDGRGWAFLAGLLCGFGNGLQFMGGQAAGYAAADAVQALPLVSTFWGIVLFGEFHRSSQRTYVLLGSMLFMFIVAVVVLMASSGERK